MSRRPRGETRRAIVDTAQRLMQRRGFHAFSYHHVAEILGVRTAAIHYHFPTKADLGVAVIGRFREDFRWWWRQQLGRDAGAAERLEAYFALDGHYAQDDRVCPLGVVGVERAGLPVPVCREAAALLEEVAGFLQETLEAGRREGTMTFPGDATAVARQVLAATQGGLQLARLAGDDAYRSVLDGLRQTLGMADAEAPTRMVG
ncbi:MAG: TetR/AcrR family transcriptional regulator [Arhodomonas sp.]|nr:TetR/AcrR family transcriptional regulator [Arhodomonas sp.]